MGGFTMNSRRGFIRQLAVGSAGVLAAQFPGSVYAAADLAHITILHTNDIHCHIDPFPETDSTYGGRGGLARLAGMVSQVRAENPSTFLFDAGDTFQGTPYFNYYKGNLMYKLMSKIGYDAGTIGNHEFDNGLSGIKDAIVDARFSMIQSNYDFSGTILNDAFLKYKVYEKDGIRIGLYALGIEMEGLVAQKNYQETKYLDPIAVALKMESFLKHEKDCDLVVCLSHLGIQYKEEKVSDKIIASKTSYTDLIIGGHTHTFLEKPLETVNAAGQPIIINQAGFGGMVLGRIDFIFDRSRKVKRRITENKQNG